MRRSEFWDNVTTWGELKDFCLTCDCCYCDCIYDEDEQGEEIDYDISEYGGDYSWKSLRDALDDIPSGYDYYLKRGTLDWEVADDEMFESYKSEVCEWADYNDVWDYEENEDDVCEETEGDFSAEEANDNPVEDEDFSVSDLIGMCSVTFVTIQEDNIRKIQEDKRSFDEFVGVNIPKVIK